MTPCFRCAPVSPSERPTVRESNWLYVIRGTHECRPQSSLIAFPFLLFATAAATITPHHVVAHHRIPSAPSRPTVGSKPAWRWAASAQSINELSGWHIDPRHQVPRWLAVRFDPFHSTGPCWFVNAQSSNATLTAPPDDAHHRAARQAQQNERRQRCALVLPPQTKHGARSRRVLLLSNRSIAGRAIGSSNTTIALNVRASPTWIRRTRESESERACNGVRK